MNIKGILLLKIVSEYCRLTTYILLYVNYASTKRKKKIKRQHASNSVYPGSIYR